jgi:hypothetical protein
VEQKLGSVAMHIVMFLSGSTAMGIVAHIVQTFPTPKNKYWAWLVGSIQYAVGQRERAENTMELCDTKTIPIQRGHQG